MYFKGVLLRSGTRMSPLFVLIIILTQLSMCKGQLDKACSVFPKDQYIEEGSSIDIVCQTCTNTKEVFWRLNNRSVDKSLSKTINSTHTVLSLRNFTHSSATVQCESRKPDQVIGGTIIKTYQKPRNISCVLHYEADESTGIEGMPEISTCTWEHQINPLLEVDYTMLCTASPNRTPQECCKTRETKCETRGLFHSGKLSMRDGFSTITVRATTPKWEVSSDPYVLYPEKILKIRRPKVTVTSFTDHMSVECNRSLVDSDGRCQVNYTLADGGTPESLYLEPLRPHESCNTSIEDVESCVNYRVSVRCALLEGPWSDWRHKTALTKLNPKHVRLHLWRKITEKENNQVRKVRAMWMDIPSTCEESREVNYTIKRTTGANYTYASCGSSPCDVDVNQDAHRITLTVSHNGRPIAEDSVYVPAVGDTGLPRVTDIQTSTSDGNILISWKAPAQPVSGYMIDWTHDGNQYHWNESKYTNATLFDLLDKKPYDVTITPLFDNKTGHGTQIRQLCSRVGEPGNVDITSVQANDRNAYVRWDTKSQDPCSGVVTNFTVYYGPPEGPLLNVTVGSNQREVFLKDLTKDSQYTVSVEATAATGNSISQERLFKTKRFDPRLVMVLSVCGSVLIVLALSLGLCCAVKWKRFWEKPVPNPGLSSVALWPSPTAKKGACLFQPFINPSGELCDKVYTEHAQSVSSPSVATDFNGCQTSDQPEEYTDTAIVLAPDVHDGEATAFLSSKSSPVSPVSPYRSQSSVESPLPKNNKQRTLKTIYVTLDMFEHGQSRRGK
ncbi:interleukin-6 receptor subunit beta-like [Mugil cephalus]|uniref:interleukin-6 receptor subunit beta-like n=1 Tax=Mugil cephalus TaxID=48193 RepID=UPI001FB73742|nr:interleukin-6 receptor subunit beta-like [Mugil cephalus]